MALVGETPCMYCHQANLQEYEKEKKLDQDALEHIILKKLNDVDTIMSSKKDDIETTIIVNARKGASERLLGGV